MREMFKDIVIGEQQYRVSRMDARTGSWIAMQLLTKLLPLNLEDKLGIPSGRLASNRSQMSEAEFNNIQDHCLAVCSRLDMIGSVLTPVPIIMVNGVWSDKELEFDVLKTMALTVQALIFNISPFFEEGALSAVLASFKDLNPSSAKL